MSVRDVGTSLTPNKTQEITLIIAGVYIIVIGILWHVPFLSWIIYPFKLLTVGFHEMSHAFAELLTCAHIHSIELDPDEGGETRMSGGIPWTAKDERKAKKERMARRKRGEEVFSDEEL